jgi:hypothetical protein
VRPVMLSPIPSIISSHLVHHLKTTKHVTGRRNGVSQAYHCCLSVFSLPSTPSFESFASFGLVCLPTVVLQLSFSIHSIVFRFLSRMDVTCQLFMSSRARSTTRLSRGFVMKSSQPASKHTCRCASRTSAVVYLLEKESMDRRTSEKRETITCLHYNGCTF